MPVVTPPAVDVLPAPPDPNNRATFNGLAYPWMLSLATLRTQLAALAANVFGNAQDAATSASAAAASVSTTAAAQQAAAASAAAAAASSGAAAWVSGATYSVGDARYSPITGLVYRRRIAGAGTIDPSLDGTNWGVVSTDPRWVIKTSAYTASAGDALLVNTTAAPFAVLLPASPVANDTVRFADYAGTWGTNKVTFGRNGKNIMGLAEDYDISTANLNGVMTFIDNVQGWKHL